MAILKGLLWLAMFAVLTFVFVIVFEHGCCDRGQFARGARVEFARLSAFLDRPEPPAAPPAPESENRN